MVDGPDLVGAYVRWHTFRMSNGPPSPEVIELMGEVAELMLAELGALVAEMSAAEVDLSPVLGVDASVMADTSASNHAGARQLLNLFIRRDTKWTVRTASFELPHEMLDVAHTVARRGLDLDVIFQSYRYAQNVAWRHFMAHATRIAPPGPVLMELLHVSSERLFDYIDYALTQVIAATQREREELLGGALARRAEAIRLVLDDAPIHSDRASERLGYQLSRRHTALVLWSRPGSETHGALESAATTLARAMGARPPLTLSVGASALWAWLGSDAEPNLAVLCEPADKIAPGIRVAVGSTLRGIAGFRRSHDQALTVQRLLAENPDGPSVGLYRDLEVTALATENISRAAEFVQSTLGALAEDNPGAERLRETLRVFLEEADNAPRTATRLHTHRNTVLQRVARAAELLGFAPGDRRLALGLALELGHRLGHRVLTRTD